MLNAAQMCKLMLTSFDSDRQELRTDKSEVETIALSDAAEEIVSACHRQLNEFVPSRRVTGTTILGMGNRIGDYKVRIKTAKNLPVASTMKGVVKLIPFQLLSLNARSGRWDEVDI